MSDAPRPALGEPTAMQQHEQDLDAPVRALRRVITRQQTKALLRIADNEAEQGDVALVYEMAVAISGVALRTVQEDSRRLARLATACQESAGDGPVWRAAAAEFKAACTPDVVLQLVALAAGGGEDTARLDAIERFGIAYYGTDANLEDVVQLTGPCHDPDDDLCDDECTEETRQFEWEVTGPPCADGFGNYCGRGTSLRAAVDDAVAEQSRAARSLTPERPANAD